MALKSLTSWKIEGLRNEGLFSSSSSHPAKTKHMLIRILCCSIVSSFYPHFSFLLASLFWGVDSQFMYYFQVKVERYMSSQNGVADRCFFFFVLWIISTFQAERRSGAKPRQKAWWENKLIIWHLECNAEIKWQSGVRCGEGMEVWGPVMQGVRAQDKDLGFYFSIKKKPWRSFK